MSVRNKAQLIKTLFELFGSESCSVFENSVECGLRIKSAIICNCDKGVVFVFFQPALFFKFFNPVVIYEIVKIHVQVIVECI